MILVYKNLKSTERVFNYLGSQYASVWITFASIGTAFASLTPIWFEFFEG